jgi:fucose 4-O-acetylase-like acetyltransferase
MRDNRIDFIRFLGFALIILAHVNPPYKLDAIRGFDVPMMVLISGISFTLSKKGETYTQYVLKRFRRLIVPTWLFLTLFFISLFALGKANDISFNKILTSYSLTSGIGYVWVIRVFFIVALLAPFISKFNSFIKSNTHYLIILSALALINECLVQYLMQFLNYPVLNSFLINFWDAVTFSLLFAVGIRFQQYSKLNIAAISIVSAIIWILYGIYYFQKQDKFVSMLHYKYPPTFYFLSYGLLASIICFFMSQYIIGLKSIIRPLLFIGRNTLWIYFWHIVFIRIFGVTKGNWIMDYIVIFGSAFLAFYIQYFIINKLILPNVQSQTVQRNIKMFLTG